MHGSVLQFVSNNVSQREVAGRSILEVGSFDVNGTVRPYFTKFHPYEYIGIDQEAGKGVDLVVSASEIVKKFGPYRFDIVVCTEMLEHAQDWKRVLSQMKKVLKINGLIYLTTRSPGFAYHPYPNDYWRFTLTDIKTIFSDFQIIKVEDDPELNGVFIKARKPLSLKEINLYTFDVASVDQENDKRSD